MSIIFIERAFTTPTVHIYLLKLYGHVTLCRVTWGHFSKNVIFVPKKNFIGVLYNLVDFWSEKCLFASKQTKKSHLGQHLYIKGSFRLIYVLGRFVRIGPR